VTTGPRSIERLDPAQCSEDDDLQLSSVDLHVSRYSWAARFARDARVLDLACGVGYGAALLAEAGAASVTGVDVAEEAVAVARARYSQPTLSFTRCDYRDFRPETPFDLLVTLETIEHVPTPWQLLRNMRAWATPKAQLVASVPTTLSTDINPYHLHDFTPSSFERLLFHAGWIVEERFVQKQPYEPFRIRGSARGQNLRRGLIRYYANNPWKAMQRVLCITRYGFENRYLTVRCSRRN
jgi:SAM-dependent methyltransferase